MEPEPPPNKDDVQPQTMTTTMLKEEGIALYKKGDIGGALDMFAKALQACPDDSPERHLILKEQGNALYKKGDVGKALEAYSQALEVCPDASDQKHLILCNRATASLALGRTRDAIKDCDESIRICPGFCKAYLRKGLALQEEGRILEALETTKLGIVEFSKDDTQAGGPELHRLVNNLQAAWRNQKANAENKATGKSNNTQPPPPAQRGKKGEMEDVQLDPELYREFQENAEQVQLLNMELEARNRALLNAELTRDYIKGLTTPETCNSLLTFVPVGRMFIRRPCNDILSDLDKEVKRDNNELEAGKQKMKLMEQKMESLKADLEEALKGKRRG